MLASSVVASGDWIDVGTVCLNQPLQNLVFAAANEVQYYWGYVVELQSWK